MDLIQLNKTCPQINAIEFTEKWPQIKSKCFLARLNILN